LLPPLPQPLPVLPQRVPLQQVLLRRAPLQVR
jgi:hypothetical protein